MGEEKVRIAVEKVKKIFEYWYPDLGLEIVK